MLSKIQFKRTTVAGKRPTVKQLAVGELAINLTDRTIFTSTGAEVIDLGFAKGGNVDGNINVAGQVTATHFNGPLNGNAVSATRLQTPRNIALTGDATGTVSFNGTANVNIPVVLSNTGVTARAYGSNMKIPTFTVDSKGRITHVVEQNLVNASTTQSGFVRLNNTLTSSSTTEALTAAQGKVLNDKIDNKDSLKTINYFDDKSSNYQLTGFYRANGHQIDGMNTSSLEIHIAHPTYSGNAYARGIGFDYGPRFDLYSHAWSPQGVHLGRKKILTEENGVQKSGDVMTGELTLNNQSWPKVQLASSLGNQALLLESGGTNGTHCLIIRPHIDGVVAGNNIARFNLPTVTGTKTIAVEDGNIATATNLQTARTINGVAFDGSRNITIHDNTKAPAVHRHAIADITDYDMRYINTEDLNAITKWGIYGQRANNQSLAERNYPVPNEAGTLEVLPGTYSIRQRFTTFNSHRTFERSRNNAENGWNAWTELSNTWDAIRNKPGNLAYTSSNVASASKLQTARNIAITGDGSWNVNFDGSGNATGALTLSNSGVRAGSYNSVTVDAKGRVTKGLNQTHGLVTATSATGTANTATTNSNTFLNIVASGVGSTNSVGSSTQVQGTNGIEVSSDTRGKLIISQSLVNSLTDTATNKSLTANMGKVLKDELDTTVKLTGDQTIAGRKSFSEITVSPASNDNSLILGVGPTDVYIKNTAAGKYLQFKNDGTLAISNNKVFLYSDRSDEVNLDRTDKIATSKAVNTLNNTKLDKTENAASATKLQTARTINGVAFDGTKNITIYDNTKLASNANAVSASRLATARTISLTGDVTGSVSFNGSGNVSMATTLNLADFANVKTENGYQKLPNGLIIQWGRVSSVGNKNFPISFPNAALWVIASSAARQNVAVDSAFAYVINKNTFYWNVRYKSNENSNSDCAFIAIGY